MSEFDVGYAMGLIVGEGSFTGDRTQPSLELRAQRGDIEPLEHLQRTLGGRIYGPYARGVRNHYAYLLRGKDLRRALPLLAERLPGGWKRAQFEAWRTRYAEFFDRPEPSPALLERVARHLSPG